MDNSNLSFYSPGNEKVIDLKAFFKKILSKWWLFIISILMGLALSYIWLMFQTPKYKVFAKIYVEDDKKSAGSINQGNLLGDMGGLLGMKSNVDNEVEILKTKFLAEKVVKGLDLNICYYYFWKFKNVQVAKSPFIFKILDENNFKYGTSFDIILIDDQSFEISGKNNETNEPFQFKGHYGRAYKINEIGNIELVKEKDFYFEPDSKYKVTVKSINEAVTNLQNDMAIYVTNSLVTTIDIYLNHNIPRLAETILNKFIQEYIHQNIIDKNLIADSTIVFIENRLLKVSEELGDVEGSIQKFKQVNNLADIPEQSKLLVSNTSNYTKELVNLETQIRILDELEIHLKDKSKNTRAIPHSAISTDAGFNRLVETFNGMLLEKDKLLLTSTESNPYIENLEERIISLKSSMLSSLLNNKRSMVISKEELQKKINDLTKELHKVPAHERAYLGMYRQQSLKQELYLYLLQKREEIALSKTSNISNAKIIDPPSASPDPYSPNKLVILLAGLFAGLIFPLGIIYLQEFMNDKIQSKEDIQKELAIPVIGEINHVESGDLFISNNLKSIVSEQFRALRTNLNFYNFNSVNGSVTLLTSSMQGEGKTFTAINLGLILALSDKKVLLIDGDLRVASSSDKFNLKNKFGFSDYVIAKEMDHRDIIYPSGLNNNFYIMPSGTIPPNPAETIMNKKVDLLFEKLKGEFDCIILDAPPVGIVADALLLAKYSSMIVYIVREGFTLKSQLTIPKGLIESYKFKNIGIVFNDKKNSTDKYYGYGQYTEVKKEGFKWTKIFKI